MYNSILLGIKQQRFNRYSEAFNFFQSKSINMIIGSRKLDYVVHYRDLQIFDDQTEYFKRYYTSNETASRTRKLINYYELNMTPPSPNLIPVHTYHLLETRHRKQIKLCIMRQKSLARRAEQQEEEQQQNSRHMILDQLDQSNFSALSTEKEEGSDHDSYDSDPFNAYENEDGLREAGYGSSKIKDFDLINLKEIADSLFVLDFKESLEEPPLINIIPPILLPPPPPKPETVSVGMQTIPVQVPVVRKEEVKAVVIPELKKEVAMTPVQQMGLRSQIKKENMVLTDSIEMVQRREEHQKAKPSTFMEYYNSQPVKAPSNLLERYIKRKK